MELVVICFCHCALFLLPLLQFLFSHSCVSLLCTLVCFNTACPNIAVWWLVILFLVPEVHGSNLCSVPGYPGWIFTWFSSTPSARYWDSTLIYEGVSKSFRTESITKYTLTTINTRWEATQSAKAAILTRLTHKIAIQLHLVAESYTFCSSRSRLPVRKLLDTT
jgi:hypothetical protein